MMHSNSGLISFDFVRITKAVAIALSIVILGASSVNGQVCGGNLGTNIFTQGDFGSGTDNILATDPGIAPGYTYRTSPPPPDGSYIITNSLAEWSDRYDWPGISSDNSSDPNGYMMVINASVAPGKFYEQVVDGLCENTLYVFSADVMNIHPAGRNYIKPNVSFSIDGDVAFTTGDVPENGEWNTYGFTFTTEPGVTSVNLSLANNAPGGIGNDLILDNIRFQACGPEALILPETTANICEDGDPITLSATVVGDQYDNVFIQWQESFDGGNTWEDIAGANNLDYSHTNLSSGMYYYRYLLAGAESNLENDKCRVNSNVKVINVIPKNYMVIDTICSGLTYELGDQLISESGSFVVTLKNYIGCDSIVQLELEVVDDPNITADFDIINPSCFDENDGSIEVLNINDGYPEYAIWVNDSINLNFGNVNDLSNGEYIYKIQDRHGCTSDTILIIEDPMPFEINLGPDQTIVLGDTVTIPITTNHPPLTYEWSSSNINCEVDCEEVMFLPIQSFDLEVLATSINGCVDTDHIFVQVDKLRPVYMPNAFSPDSDGVNDYFTIYGDESKIIEIVELEVYDRWSSLIFEKTNFLPNDPLQGWDGQYKGISLNAGSYLFVAYVRFIDDEVLEYSETVTIVR